MIDYAMYKRLHPPTHQVVKPGQFRPEPSWMDEMPEDASLAFLSPKILGFDFSNKSWKNLMVDRITEVTWNKAAFKQLVAPEETKELIQATVTVHGQRSSATMDIIDGKGQGLLMLLHGGPGTGKTLTAESIAEMQERPLYRVTCGDIGIEPKEVEEYLGHVLELGKTWGCGMCLTGNTQYQFYTNIYRSGSSRRGRRFSRRTFFHRPKAQCNHFQYPSQTPYSKHQDPNFNSLSPSTRILRWNPHPNDKPRRQLRRSLQVTHPPGARLPQAQRGGPVEDLAKLHAHAPAVRRARRHGRLEDEPAQAGTHRGQRAADPQRRHHGAALGQVPW